jgi:hypothetical protein
VSDFFLSDILGGGELNDHELCHILSSMGRDVTKIKSHQVSDNFLKEEKNSCFIISNFINLSPSLVNLLSEEHKYVIYEHDHKYLKSRNPAIYKDFIAPETEIINYSFYKNAKAVFCQSSFHEGIIKKNLDIDNIINVSGNLWSLNSLKTIGHLARRPKRNEFSIMNSNIPHKNTREACFYCEKKGLKYNLISSKSYEEFLSLLSNNEKFLFLPKTPETLSRVVVEARMMGVKTITNKNVGASYEPWIKLKGQELISIMKNRRNEIPNKVIEVFGE